MSDDKETEMSYSQFFSRSNDLLCIASFNGYFKFFNPMWTKTFGWSDWEFTNKPFIDFAHPEDRHACSVAYLKLAAGEEVFGLENRFLCQDGSYKWLSWNATASGDERLIYAVARDITARKENEVSQQQYIKELEALKFALNIHSLVAITDRYGRVTYANEKFCEVSKYSKEELIGQDHRIVNSGYHSQDFFKNLWRTISQGNLWKGEIKNKAKDGTYYWVDTLIVPFLDKVGKPYQYVAIRTDITQRKLSELALLERSRLSLLSAEINLAISQSSSLPEILQSCTKTLSQYLDTAFVCIWTFENQTHQIQLQAGIRCTDRTCQTLTNSQDFPNHAVLANSIIGLMTKNNQALFNEEITLKNEEYFLEPFLSNFLLAAYPLIIEQQSIGILALFSKELFSNPTHNLLNWIANSVAVAIDRIWAREELLSRREALLLRLASQIRNSLELNTILATAVSEIRSLLQIDRCYFLRYLPNLPQPTLTITHEARNSDLPTMLGNIPVQKVPFLVNILLNGELLCIDAINSTCFIDCYTQEFLSKFGIQAQILLPVKNNSGEFGAIVCSHSCEKRIWSHSEISLLQAVTDQLAIAIDHAQLYRESCAATLAAQTHAEKLSETLQKLQETQAQLIQHEKMSSLGQLVAGVAHEINNPVNFIHGNITHASEYIQDLLELLKLYNQHYPYPAPEIRYFGEEIEIEFLADDLSKLLSSMKLGTNRIREIVLSLRNFSRLDEAAKKPVDIHEGLENTLLILQHRLKSNKCNISLVKEYNHLPLVDCYPGQLNQVFMNILTNAIDALEEGNGHGAMGIEITPNTQCPMPTAHSPTIHISTAVTSNNFALIQIADNGFGMTEDIRKRLFDPFFTTKPVGKGTGLGLSISYQIIVEKHGGSLKCISEPGKGTEFLIQIPISSN
ncbi:PAS domain S-box protein [Scytonema sp. UIC 10036]|uniref:PAS domain S-box protein n=1 Tax=Scytonema sp. UIC 10036 TaxID=2304196 RepID=UPI0012DAED74|nr:PAS domain S-box protein [Scytonema sp. UIC 10036]MUG91551.1 PAS domain S-box protein [Scytonema sp. UIC 10036]